MRSLCAILMAWLLLGTTAARAGETAISPEAKKHVDNGIANYDAGHYQEAIDEFELAYRLSNRPALLFNIARAEAKLGHDQNAIAFLRRYLEERPDAPDAAAVMAEIDAREKAVASAKAMEKAEAEAQVERKRAAEAERAAAAAQKEAHAKEQAHAAPAPAATASIVAAPADADRRRAHARARHVGYGLVAGGAAVAIVGIVLGVLAQQAGNNVHAATGPFTPDLQSTESNGITYQAAGIALDVVGAAIAVSGVGLIGWGARR